MTKPSDVPPRPQRIVPSSASITPSPAGTNLFCPVCGHEFLPDELGKKPHCRHCGYLES